MSSRLSFPISISLLLLISISLAQAAVPANKTFKYTIEGNRGEYIVEYAANYRKLALPTKTWHVSNYFQMVIWC